MPKPSEATERDRELAALCTTGICYCDEAHTCAWHRDIVEACHRARAEGDAAGYARGAREEREAIRQHVLDVQFECNDSDGCAPDWMAVDAELLCAWIEARGKEGEGDAKP